MIFKKKDFCVRVKRVKLRNSNTVTNKNNLLHAEQVENSAVQISTSLSKRSVRNNNRTYDMFKKKLRVRVKRIKLPLQTVTNKNNMLHEEQVENNAVQISTNPSKQLASKSTRKPTPIMTSSVKMVQPAKKASTNCLTNSNNKIISTKPKNVNAVNMAGKHKKIEEILNSIEDEVDSCTTDQVEIQANLKQDDLQNKKRKVSLRRLSGRKRSHIYDFSAESFEEDSDPMSDIIKKLIKDKKVRVATCNKGTGRPILKRLPAKNSKRIVKTKKTKGIMKSNKIPDMPVHTQAKAIQQPQTVTTPILQNKNHKSSKISPNAAQSSFSNLARSVLLHETNKTHSPLKQILNKNSGVQNVISTPIKQNPVPQSSPTFSPIPYLSNKSFLERRRNLQATSPWRVDRSAHLPQEFNFSCNAENLPTFSSDIINKPEGHVESFSKITDIPTNAHNSSSSTSSTNDSNIENIPPPLSSTLIEVNNENTINLRQQTNSRILSNKRSPLKALNIIEVVNLPPWKPVENDQLTSHKKSRCLVQTKQAANKNTVEQTLPLFGFEEFIDNEENREIDKTIQDSINSTNQNETLREKLHQLQKWRPTTSSNISNLNSSTIAGDLFEHPDHNTIKQRCIKQMLCSTMINPKANLKAQQFANNNNAVLTKNRQSLFKDAEPSISFDNTLPHRTYERLFKRKRKLRQNFVMYMDSDESGEEEHVEEHIHKRQRKERINPELEEFAKKFNSMCEEVQQFELITE